MEKGNPKITKSIHDHYFYKVNFQRFFLYTHWINWCASSILHSFRNNEKEVWLVGWFSDVGQFNLDLEKVVLTNTQNILIYVSALLKKCYFI